MLTFLKMVTDGVSIHAPAWGATRFQGRFDRGQVFQFTLPRGERRHASPRGFASPRFQFTLPRGERLVPCEPIRDRRTVSIHAPAWGATGRQWGIYYGTRVSIHAPAWGATSGGGSTGGDSGVSIHAPAWGATCKIRFRQLRPSVSIHAPAWGATWETGSPVYKLWWFQFTLPRGERHGHFCTLKGCAGFNSRSRVGSDLNQNPVDTVRGGSIHAPAWGATSLFGLRWRWGSVSIHAPAWGATPLANRRG